MFIVQLRFSDNRAAAKTHMAEHNAWLDQGFAEGVFLLSGSLMPQAGGCILAHDISLEALTQRVNEDPFVAERVVSADIVELNPGRTDPRLAFLLAGE